MDTAQYQPVKLTLGTFGVLLTVTALSLAVCTNIRTYADTTVTDDVTITIASACTFTGDATGTEHTTSIIPGTVESNIGTTRMTAVCNDPSGYDIYAVGYSGNEWKNTNLIYEDTSGTTYNIPTGTATSGNTSNWAMKLATGTGDGATIISPYNDYAAVPGGSVQDPGDKTGDYVKVATYSQATTGASGSSLTSTYRVYATSSQVAGTYTGQVKYTLVHPQGTKAPEAKDPFICDTETCMQNLTSSTIATLLPNVGSTATVYDARDEQAYTIAKLDDGNYWMVSNMNIGKGNGEIITLTSDDSDLPAGTTFDLKASGVGSTPPDASGDCNVGEWPIDTAEDYSISYLYKDSNHPEYGTYYGWYAATAGTGTYALTSGNAAGSICPKGWKLPPNTGNGSYANLVSAAGWSGSAGFTAMQQAPYSFQLAGSTYGGGIDDQGSLGGYWSSTAYDSKNARYFLFFDGSNISPQYYGNKVDGSSVRYVFGS